MCQRRRPVEERKNTSLVKSCRPGKTLLAHKQNTQEQSSSTEQVWSKTNYGLYKAYVFKNTYLLLFIGSDRSDISSKTAVAASINLLVVKTSGAHAHSLVSILHQGGPHPLDLQDLSLNVYSRQTKKQRKKQVAESEEVHTICG